MTWRPGTVSSKFQGTGFRQDKGKEMNNLQNELELHLAVQQVDTSGAVAGPTSAEERAVVVVY